MPDVPDKQKILYDAIGAFYDGQNAGADPQTIPRTQAAYLENGTIRNDFVRPRAAYRKLTLDFGGDNALEQHFAQALYQGGCYYKPDAGSEALIASIGGRLFKVVPTDNTATVSDISIPGDLDSASSPIAWLWQAENFVIRNDGTARPVFFDGNTSRRAGAGTLITTLSADYTAAAIGSIASASLTAAYTGPANALLSIPAGTEPYLFQVVSSTSGIVVRLLNITDTPGNTVSSGATLIWKPGYVGPLFSASTFSVTSQNTQIQFSIDAQSTLLAGQELNIPGTSAGDPFNGPWHVVSVQTYPRLSITVRPGFTYTQPIQVSWAAGAEVRIVNYLPRDTTLNTTAINFTVPAQVPGVPSPGPYVDATLLSNFSGSTGIYVWIGSKQYYVYSVQSSTASSTVALLNLNAPTTAAAFKNLASVTYAQELPPGKMGAYWRGRNWIALPDGKSFIASDLRGGPYGSAAYKKRDAILRTYENTLLAGGGSFSVPGNAGDIQAIIGTAQLDAALGQGPLAVIATNIVFSCQAPANRQAWQDLTDPILSESAITSGGEGQNSTVTMNSDPVMRAKEGIRSLIYARREFTSTGGNTPISREVQPTLDEDNPALLLYGSAVIFNNRLLMTAHPRTSALGVYHDKLIALNNDPLSSLKGKLPPAYDGIWTGLNVLQVIVGKFGGSDRCFAFALNAALNRVELWEIQNTDGVNAPRTDDGELITIDLQTGALNYGQDDPRSHQCLRLLDGEIYIDQMTADVTFTAYYKPDEWPNWVPWRTWTEKFNPDSDPGFRPRLGLGEPSAKVYDNVNKRSLRDCYTHQFRIVIDGPCRFKGARFKATTIPKPEFAPVAIDAV